MAFYRIIMYDWFIPPMNGFFHDKVGGSFHGSFTTEIVPRDEGWTTSQEVSGARDVLDVFSSVSAGGKSLIIHTIWQFLPEYIYI